MQSGLPGFSKPRQAALHLLHLLQKQCPCRNHRNRNHHRHADDYSDTDDDRNAVCYIYPQDERTVTCLNDPITLTAAGSSNGGSCDSTPGQTGPGAALSALALLLQIKRRSKRKPQLAMIASSAPANTSFRSHGQVS